ncbi:serine threonine-protein kinase prp4 [Diplodia corticola]|uniref:Serine threonine-protein kinase prp4 n=1 Tax=Diplodia corticola TaxID=236234 RepID=A0A1J9QN47_9PEZI|nr:serine threonine-protein kinase prp4 [Diplodia corticola]OJD29888.1 serine threonine-protein kinase prp4 [Diplodia corticola]
MTLRLSRLPGVYNGVRCENCSYKWFGLGGNSTHTSLVSQQTRTLTFASDLSGYASTAPTGDATAGTSALVTRLHSMGALGSPFITNCSIPQMPEDNHEQVEARPPSRLRAYIPPSLGRHASSLSKHSSRSSRARREQPQQSGQADPASHPGQAHQGTDKSGSKIRGLTTRVKGKLKAVLFRLRQVKAIRRARRRTSCQSVDTSRATTTENSRPLSVSPKESRSTNHQALPNQQGQASMSTPRSPAGIAPRALSRRQSAPEPGSQPRNFGSDRHGEEAYQKPFSLEKRPGDPESNERIQEIRRAKTISAQQTRCECSMDCYCKRPTSSLVPDNPLTDRDSLAGLDLAQSSGSHISRDSRDLIGIGSHFLNHHPNISEAGFSMSSAGSIRGRSQTRRGREISWRRSNATWGSQASTAYADSDAGSSTATRSSFPRSDLLHIATTPRRTHIPSPLASPTNLNGFLDHDNEHTPRRPESISSADEDYSLSERAPDGIPSVSPIQEAASGGSARVSTISMSSDYGYRGESVRVSIDAPEVGGTGQSNYSSSQPHGPLNSHPAM